jgi:hypothetical protein
MGKSEQTNKKKKIKKKKNNQFRTNRISVFI